ncbi:uncharacterized mitochondrial protein AtMg00810-like [Gossypium hirsutum]|uniref:Uncharacterized mitochondrial protein AtMg00810-like n=1 Tax=Gossypium hirsutum TaxID=3635 RepID=A0A1U8IAN2_GOSHI|nr:uncharacterized mitochondrial protein AtMg00810-like [Gossypium hirsutum]
MVVGKKLAKDDGNALSDLQHYRSIVGSLQYLCHTRPDISYSVNKVAQYMQNPRYSHWVAVKRILRYLRGTLDYGLVLTSGSNIISWSSKKQRSVSRSTVEAEYRSLTDTASEII